MLSAGGAVPWDHFSILPSTPQAVSPRKIGRAKPRKPGRRRQHGENGRERGRVDACVSNRRGHGAEQAERGLLAVEQIADGLPERAVDLAERRRLAVGAGGEDGLDRSSALPSCAGCGVAIGVTPGTLPRTSLALQPLDQRHQPLQQRGDVIRPSI